MKPNLLTDILQEGNFPEFRDDLSAKFRAEVRRRRHRKMAVFAITALAASIAIVAMLVFPPKRSDLRQASKKESVPTIRSTPLPVDQVLRTAPMFVEAVESRAIVVTFKTTSNPNLESIDDSQLLAIFHNYPAGLFQMDAGEELIFLNPEDTKRFMSSN
jgi:hypothetical protein